MLRDDMALILAGFRHDPSGPALVLDALDAATPIRRALAIRGAPLSLRWGTARYCTGSFDLDTYASTPCPDRALASDAAPACPRCFRRTGFNPSFYNVPLAALSPQQRMYNDRPHVVYLAGFSRFLAKVGISSRDRVPHRWRGQGARLALVLARCADAYEAREHEARISKGLALPELVRGEKKRTLINEPLDVARTDALLRETRRAAETTLGLPTLDAAVEQLDAHYLGAERLALPLVDLSGLSPPTISGVGVGLIGDVLIVAQGAQQFMIGLGTLIGRTIELSHALCENPVRSGGDQLGFGF